jgi:hypothetical protein
MDVARASDQIDALIVRRATQTAAENEREELWRASVRRHHDKLRTERLRDRLAYHSAMIESHSKNFEELLKRHHVGLRLCEEALGIAAGPGNGRP